MAKITKTEFLNNIQNIINEGMSPDVKVDHAKKFEISHYVNSLFEAGQTNPRLMSYLNKYINLLNSNTVKEFQVFEQFGQGLAQYASGNKDVKAVIAHMNDTLSTNAGELKARCLMECIHDPQSKECVIDAFNNYMDEDDEDSRNVLIDAVDMLDQEGDPVAPQLTIIISNDLAGEATPIVPVAGESKFDEIQRKIKEDKQRKQMEAVKAQVDAYARKVFDDAAAAKAQEEAACTFESIINNNGINLRESIKNIVSSDAKSNKKLMETMEQYAGALNQGLYEERLYEGFVQNIAKYNYLLPVEKELKRINEAVAEKASSIEVTKILEEMSTTPSYYIIPLIEEDAARYVKNPTDINRNALRAALYSFASDPYCNAILEAIDKDGMRYNTIDEKAMTVKDQIKVIRQNANVTPVYSPVQYIKENECVFNANGQFYVKKGNTLAKLSDEYLNQLSESFIALCQLVNDPRVTINEDNIVLLGNDKIATIYEGYVDVNGNRETQDTLRNLNEMCMKYDFDTNFFVMASCLLENFNNIAQVNFGKHIALNENTGINLDMFRLGNNIFINTVNEDMNKSTFYHNVNPIQCRNIINKHMGINVASLFEDLLPSQDKLLMKLNETKDEYQASIEKYEATIEKLKKAKDECVSGDNEKKLDTAIESAEKKVEELKSEYKDWQAEVEKSTKAKSDDDVEEEPKDDKKAEKKADKDIEDDPNTEVETSSEPIDAKDVDAAKAELSQPLAAGAEGADVEEPAVGGEISDQEFDSYLDGDTDADVPAEDEVPAEEPEAIGDEGEPDAEEPIEDEVPAEDGEEVVASDDDETLPEVSFEEPDAAENAVEISDEEPVEQSPIDLPEDTAEGEEVEDEPEAESVSVPEGYQISNVAFDENVKTGKLFKTGSVTVSCPMVDAEGKMYMSSNDYHFYIDEETHLPICDAADIPVALYNAIVATIQEDPDFERADSEGEKAEAPAAEAEKSSNWFDKDEIDAASDELTKNDDDAFFDFTEDPEDGTLTISSKEPIEVEEEPEVSEPEDNSKDLTSLKDIFGISDDEEAEVEDKSPVVEPEASEPEVSEPVIPTYKDGDTEIELPAADADDTIIPEVETPESKEAVADAEADVETPGEETDDVIAAEPEDDMDTIEISDEEPEDTSVASDEDGEEKDFPDYDDVKMDGEDDEIEEATFFGDPDGPEEPVIHRHSPEFDAAKAAHPHLYDDNEMGEALKAASVAIKNAQDKLNLKKDPAVMKNVVDESVKVANRKNLVSLSAVLSKGGRDFFLSEGTIKPSKKEDAHINENLDGVDPVDEAPVDFEIEEYDKSLDANTLEIMQSAALTRAAAAASDGIQVEVSDIKSNNDFSYFTIISDNAQYVIYQINNEIYYRDYDEFLSIMIDLENGIGDIEQLKYDFETKEQLLDYIFVNDIAACEDLVNSIFLSLGVDIQEPIDENIKIKTPKLGADGDIEKSKMVEDILHGTEDQRNFEEKVEKDTQKAGVDNPLAPSAQPQQESAKRILPNANVITESAINEKKEDDVEIIYEPGDWVIIKETGMKAQVTDVMNDGDGKLSMLIILASDGISYEVEDLKEIEPDPLYLENIPGRVINSQNLEVPRLAEFDIDLKTRMPKPVENEKLPKDWHQDLNGKSVRVYVLANGMRLNAEPYVASMEDLKESKKMIRVMNEAGEVEEYDVDKNIEFAEKPYAVIVNSEGKPVRTIKIDPMSYINAAEDELVDCECGDKPTKFPKKCIDVLS